MTKQEILDKVSQEAKLRGLSIGTQKEYYSKVKLFQDFYDKPATELDIEDVRKYLYYLIDKKELESCSVNTYNSGLRFLYEKVLDQHINTDRIPRHRRMRKTPEIFTKEEIQELLDSCDNLRNKALIMTAYSSGLRVSEVVNLKVKDIDSKKMQIFICQGKGKKDRFAILSQKNLELLREYWLKYKPREYLFPGRTGKQLSVRGMQTIFDKQVEKAGIIKSVTTHSLRHSFATHLLEEGADLFHIKQLLGHEDIRATCFYLHMIKISELNIKSPIDTFTEPDKRHE